MGIKYSIIYLKYRGSESVFSFFGKTLESQKEKKNAYDITLKGDSGPVAIFN